MWQQSSKLIVCQDLVNALETKVHDKGKKSRIRYAEFEYLVKKKTFQNPPVKI